MISSALARTAARVIGLLSSSSSLESVVSPACREANGPDLCVIEHLNPCCCPLQCRPTAVTLPTVGRSAGCATEGKLDEAETWTMKPGPVRLLNRGVGRRQVAFS